MNIYVQGCQLQHSILPPKKGGAQGQNKINAIKGKWQKNYEITIPWKIMWIPKIMHQNYSADLEGFPMYY